jgi:NitT/TauT family transport system substrate-binding protein
MEKVSAVWLPIMQTTAYYVALEEKLFEKACIEIVSNKLEAPNQIIDALVGARADFGPPGAAAGIAMLAESKFPGTFKVFGLQGGGIKVGLINDGLIVKPDSDIKSFADLKGKKVAIGAPGTGTASALNEALKKGGLKYSDVDVVYIGFPEHLPTYKNKGIDASITNEPTMTRAIEDGVAVRVAGNDITYPDQQTAVTFYADNFIRNRRDVAERFMRAYLRGVRMYNDALKDGRLAGPKANEVIPILVKYTTIKDESMFRRMVPSYCNPDGEVNVTSLKKDLEFFRELGLIEKKDASVDGVVDSSFAKAAVAKLGPYRAQAN